MNLNLKLLLSSLLVLSLLVFGCRNCTVDSGERVIDRSIRSQKLSRQEDLTVNGSLKLEQVQVKSLTVNGSAKLGPKASTIDGRLIVNGSFNGDGISVSQETSISGSATIKNSSLQELKIHGHAELSSTTVEGNVLVYGKALTLNSGTTIRGSIQFMNEPG